MILAEGGSEMNGFLWFLLFYAVVIEAGGVMGYVMAKSQMSLIAGLASGTMLLVAFFIARQKMALGMGLAAVVALALLIFFVMRYLETGKFMPAGVTIILSVIALIVFIIGALRAR